MSVSKASLVSNVLDDLIAWFGSGDCAAEVAAARAEYDERRGRVFEDEVLWEAWTQAFLEWYVLERTFTGDLFPPAAQALAREEDPQRAAALRALLTSHRSLFEVRRSGGGRVTLLDLIGGGEFEVTEQRALHGVEPGDVVEARLVGVDEVCFARTFCFHPAGTRDSIIRHIARLREQGKERHEIIDYVAGLRVRSERYNHVPPEKIYELPD
jgi:hypothetical protein